MRLRVVLPAVVLTLLLGVACQPQNPTAPVAPPTSAVTRDAATTTPLKIDTIQDLRAAIRSIVDAGPESQHLANTLYNTLRASQRLPLVLGDQAVFMYWGDAQRVTVTGDFAGWDLASGQEARRIGQSDLWIAQRTLPVDSRIEYKFVVDGENWILDPANPVIVKRSLGDNNVVAMPRFVTTDESDTRPDVAHGTMSDNLTITSEKLGYDVNYRVYTPAGYEQLKDLPVVYAIDGNDFVDPDMGKMPAVLDNLIADGRMRPVIGVFVDAREPGHPENNRREQEFLAKAVDYGSFLAEELVPAIDAAYRTDPNPNARLIQGVSYGGLYASYFAVRFADVFHNLAIFSPSFWALGDPDSVGDPAKAAGVRAMNEVLSQVGVCGGETGITCPTVPLKIFMSGGLPDWDVGDLDSTAEMLTATQIPLRYVETNEGHSWGAWSDLLDEMLLYFFAD